MIEQDQTIEQLLLPVELKSGIMPQQNNARPAATFYYISAANQSIITLGIPRAWGQYIVEKLNDGRKPIKDEKGRQPEIIYRMMIPHECPMEHQGQVFELGEDGLPYRVPNWRFNRLVQKVKHNKRLFTKFRKPRLQLPLSDDYHLVCTFYVTEDNPGNLADFLATATELIKRIGIVQRIGHNRIMSHDGSRVVYVDKEDVKIEMTLKEYRA